MSGSEEVLVGLVMALGLVGVVAPLLPGLLLVWAAGLAWVLLDGGGVLRWGVFAGMSLLLVGGTVAKYALPGRSARSTGAPWSTLLAGLAGAVVGAFVLPVLGLVVGGLLGVFAAELARHRTLAGARQSTRAVLVGIGIGLLVEFAAGAAMVGVWLLGVLVT